jgi:hypothetical protein
MQIDFDFSKANFNGSDYNHNLDGPRLGNQLNKIFELMKDAEFRTLEQISLITSVPSPSVSAQLRHLRKQRFGSHTVNKKNFGGGLFMYQLIVKNSL